MILNTVLSFIHVKYYKHNTITSIGGIFSKRVTTQPVSTSTVLPITNSFVEISSTSTISSATATEVKNSDHSQYVEAATETDKFLNENGERDVLNYLKQRDVSNYLKQNVTNSSQVVDKIKEFYHQKLIIEFETVIKEIVNVYDVCGTEYSIYLDADVLKNYNVKDETIENVIQALSYKKEFVAEIKKTYGPEFNVRGYKKRMILYWSLKI